MNITTGVNNLLWAHKTKDADLARKGKNEVLKSAQLDRKLLSPEESELFDQIIASVAEDRFVGFVTEHPLCFVELRNMTNKSVSRYIRAITYNSKRG